MNVTLTVNGEQHRLIIEPRVTLLDALREYLGKGGSKKGCDHGQCGACTVLIDGQRVYSCLALAVMQEGIENDGFQCGYCTPGQICATVALIEEVKRGCASAVTPELHNPPVLAELSEGEIKERLSGNLCRCSAYNGIIAAVQQVIGQQPPSPLATVMVSESGDSKVS